MTCIAAGPNQEGGVAKTTLTANVEYALARGKTVFELRTSSESAAAMTRLADDLSMRRTL